jgi:hypothetical protein
MNRRMLRRLPIYGAVDVFLNRGNLNETGDFMRCHVIYV